MSNNCADRKHPLIRNGVSQPERMPAALPPGQASIDDRKLEELLAFAYRYAELVLYYNTANEQDGNWQRFFEMDDTSLLAVISQLGDSFLESFSPLSDFDALVSAWINRLGLENPFKAELEAILSKDIAEAATETDAEKKKARYLKAFRKIRAKTAQYLPQMLERSSHKPHMALFLTFLNLYKHLQHHLNTLPKRHLDFFLEKVLRLKRKPQEPDTVHIRFQLADNQKEHLLPAGAQLLAGKDSLGNKMMYALKDDLVVNRAQVERIHTLFIDWKDRGKAFAAPIANSADGQGAEFEKVEVAHWAPFGNSDQPGAEIGFAIASPILFLKEGNRHLTLILELDETPAGMPADNLSAAFELFLSGEKAWLPVEASAIKRNGASLIFNLQLDVTYPPVTGFNGALLPGGFQTSLPILKVLLRRPDEAGDYYSYGHLSGIGLVKATIDVQCTGLSSLVLQNDYAQFEVGKAFQPFGPRPKLGANFYIGSAEAFQKSLGYLGITIEWDGLPEDFKDHYEKYGTGIGNSSFKVNTYALNNRNWEVIKNQQTLFREITSADYNYTPEGYTLSSSYIHGIDSQQEQQFSPNHLDLGPTGSFQAVYSQLPYQVYAGPTHLSGLSLLAFQKGTPGVTLNFSPQKQILPLDAYTPTTDCGFIRLQLTDQDFLHDEYAKVYTKAVVTNPDDPALPNEPYTPTIRQVLLDYKCSTEVVFSENKFYHIYPFGQAPVGQTGDFKLLPEFLVGAKLLEGALYLGFRGLQPKQTLSLLFQMLEGSGDPEVALPAVQWAYLSNDNWIGFAQSQVLSDTTLGLVQSGIVKLQIPSDIRPGNTILGSGLSWLRLAVTDPAAEWYSTHAFPRLIDIQAQAGLAVFQDQGNAPDHLNSALPAGTITKLSVRNPAIAEVTQPFASFGGKLLEDDAGYYRRTSEYLRHKGKAINIWDYERLILEAFPAVYKVKCISHHNSKKAVAPGHVLVGLIPDLANRNAVNPFEPKVTVGTQAQVLQFLRRRVTPFIQCNLHVVSPTYEQVKVYFGVRFNKGYDDFGYYTEVLNEAIKRFLAPWAYESTAKIAFGGKMNVSEIIHFIEQLPYVDYIDDFKADHYVGMDLEKANVWEIETTGPVSVLTSAEQHGIYAINASAEETFNCPDKNC